MQQFAEFVINNWWLFAALLVILVLLGMGMMADMAGGATRLDTVALTRLINDEDCTILDVRPRGEYDAGHILNARTMPASELDNRLSELDKFKSKPVVICCQSGSAAGAIGKKLKEAGFERTYQLQGGMMAWKSASLPTVKA